MAIKIFIAGDVVPRDRTIPLFQTKQTEILFGEMRHIINDADIRVVNLEAPVIYGKPTPIKKSGPTLYTTKETIEVLKNVGFNVVTLANNHFRDQGDQGVNDTIDSLKINKLNYIGGGKNAKEASNILYCNVVDKKVAFINVCEHEFSVAIGNRGGLNALDIINIYHDIIEAKKCADYVIVIIHGGIEMYQLPTPRMKRNYRFFIDAGADAVVNHHQHCFSGYEIYKDKPIFYGLGNFCFDWDGRRNCMWNKGFAVVLSLGQKVDYEIYPYLQCGKNPGIIMQDKVCYGDAIRELNKIIADDGLLEEKFTEFANKKKRDFFYILSPFDNRYIAALNRRGILKFLYRGKKLYAVKNLIWCESHRDVLMKILDKETY